MTSTTSIPQLLHLASLSVAGGYVGLGLYAIVRPFPAAGNLGAPSLTPSSPNAQSMKIMTMLLGARDLSMGAALFAFAYERQWRSMGTLIVCGTLLCAADVLATWRAGLRGWAAQLGVGAAVWTGIGVGLLGL